MNATLAHARALFRLYGHKPYGESLSQLEHALQCATLAEASGAPDSEIVAALFHDVGHLALSQHSTTRDLRHELIGARFLSESFSPPVYAPIALHVDAKRYLCAVDDAYASSLSPSSAHSLTLQGGPMTRREVKQFIQTPYAAEAIRLRRHDDAAKVPGARTEEFEYFVERYVIPCLELA